MGTYGRGEIAALCEWVQADRRRDHGDRAGPPRADEDRSTASSPRSPRSSSASRPRSSTSTRYGLQAVADANRLAGKRVLACSAEHRVRHRRRRARRRDESSATKAACSSMRATADRVPIESQAQPTNLASRSRIALAVDVPWSDIASRLDDLPRPEHRQELAVAASGVHVIDNTFSSNPASAASSLSLLAVHRCGRRPSCGRHAGDGRAGPEPVPRERAVRRAARRSSRTTSSWSAARTATRCSPVPPEGSRRCTRSRTARRPSHGFAPSSGRRRRALRERPARPLSRDRAATSASMCPVTRPADLVRGALPRARHQRADRPPGGRRAGQGRRRRHRRLLGTLGRLLRGRHVVGAIRLRRGCAARRAPTRPRRPPGRRLRARGRAARSARARSTSARS